MDDIDAGGASGWQPRGDDRGRVRTNAERTRARRPDLDLWKEPYNDRTTAARYIPKCLTAHMQGAPDPHQEPFGDDTFERCAAL